MPRPQMHNVQSSKVFQLGYDDEQRAYYVRYTPTAKHPAGRVAIFSGVPPEVVDRVESAPSIGRALGQFVEGIYPFDYES